MHHFYFVVHKPYGMLPQFTDELDRPTLAQLYPFPKDVYPVGRLDMDSEGLLLLTNDKRLNHRLLDPKFGHEREYVVQVEGIPTENDLLKFKDGVIIQGIKTKPAKAKWLDSLVNISDRTPPIRYRATIPDSWISLSLTEGKNRQVRKMTAAIGFPTLRLIRIRIENLTLDNLKPGEVRELTSIEVKELLRRVRLSSS